MRVLQLKVYDEEEAEDPTTVMRKAQGIIAGKMDQAKDWLSNPSADANGLGRYKLVSYENVSDILSTHPAKNTQTYVVCATMPKDRYVWQTIVLILNLIAHFHHRCHA